MAQTTGKVLYNVSQNLNDYQKALARSNIDAAASSSLSTLSNKVTSLTSKVTANSNALATLKWTKVDIDESITTEATELFTINNLTIGYYFDSAAKFRLSMKSTDGTRYVYLADNMGYGGGYQVTDSSWMYITMNGFSNSCQLESLIGYDCTADLPIHFEVQFANSVNSSFTTICRYRVLE